MLGTYRGKVESGSRTATKLGFPTLNIPIQNSDISGIYAARVVVDDTGYNSAIFADQKRKVLEAHLLDFSGDLYGKPVSIELHKKIRESKHFESAEELSQAIATDVQEVRAYFAEHR